MGSFVPLAVRLFCILTKASHPGMVTDRKSVPQMSESIFLIVGQGRVIGVHFVWINQEIALVINDGRNVHTFIVSLDFSQLLLGLDPRIQ